MIYNVSKIFLMKCIYRYMYIIDFYLSLEKKIIFYGWLLYLYMILF